MKLIKSKGFAFLFTTRIVNYGKILKSNKYKIELLIPFLLGGVDAPITIYRSEKKPVFKNLYLLSILWFPFLILSYIACTAFILAYLVFWFFFEEFESNFVQKLSNFIKLVLSVIGVIAIFNYIF